MVTSKDSFVFKEDMFLKQEKAILRYKLKLKIIDPKWDYVLKWYGIYHKTGGVFLLGALLFYIAWLISSNLMLFGFFLVFSAFSFVFLSILMPIVKIRVKFYRDLATAVSERFYREYNLEGEDEAKET